MKYLNIFSPLLLLALVLICYSLLLQPSYGVPSEILLAICSNTTNQKQCESILTNEPATSTADLYKLSLISTELLQKQAKSNLQTYKEFRENTTSSHDAALKKAFDDCIEDYEGAESHIEIARQLSLKGRYQETFDKFSLALKLAEHCLAGIPLNNNHSVSCTSGPYNSFSLLIEISENVNRLLA
ncbi:hypothetical protein FNV43_RR04358 [Rhamnella rubrinervis]|uniref:Pectinesterase inhibitor domain-containing protein n=1 Tax=Rhamnella rubrinervis TaxID=2594499 RepID=A0A8K0HJF0_9ROSA|nr:hypothetical protein FNV43_RR04358 [Rhamnella rubrinervis]